MTVQERFRRQRADAGAGPAISVSRPQIGIGGTLAVVAAVLVLLAVALWVPAATMAVAVVSIGLGGIAWRKGRARPRKTGDLEHAELARLWHPIPAAAVAAPRTLAGLLAPEAAPSTSAEHAAERADLLEWCTDPTALPVRVLAGPAGAGKSRLAVDLARALEEGWAAGVARPGTAGQIVAAAASAARKVLVVVDDADIEPAADIATLFGQAEAAQERVRVLLLARDAGTFGAVLDEHLPAGACESTTLPAGGTDDDRRRLFADAVRDFICSLDAPPRAEPERGPVGADGESAAITRARAALAVLADDPEIAKAMRTADLDRLTDEIRTQEKKRWNTDALEPDAQEEALTALLLRDPRGVEDAIGVLQALPLCRDRDEAEVRDIAIWARRLYPGATDGPEEPWLDPRPSLLRGALLVSAIDRHRSHLDAALDDDPRVFLRIARAAAYHPRLAALLPTLLTDARLVPVIEAAVRADRLSLRDDLVAAVTGRTLDGADIERLLPITEAPMWAPLRVALRRAEVRRLRDATGADRVRLARALTDLGGALRGAGACDDALGPLREAVEIHRDLAADRPADLAAALAGLGATLRVLGMPHDALTATREAVRLWRDLGADHVSDLARSLIELAALLRETGAHEDALTTGREAVRLAREPAVESPARHLPDLAAALTDASACLQELGAYDAALPAAREAVRLYRDLAGDDAGAHGPDLARSLSVLGAGLREAGEHGEAVAACREAVQRYRELPAAHRTRHLPGLARSLTVLGASLREVGSYQAGLAACREAVRLSRELAAADPVRYNPDLARSLTNLGIGLRGLEASCDGLAPGIEAVRLHRQLAVLDPARYTPDLARSLTELGISLRARGAHADALAATGEAVELGRTLSVANPPRHIPDLTRSLIGLGASLRAFGRRPEAVLHEGEAVAWWWHLAQRRPGAFDERYRDAQRRYLRTFSPHEHSPDDVLTAELIARSQVQAYLDGTALPAQRGHTEDELIERSA
jgi:tetratricopeptide (TPR) repeat protein